ncbi:hypothetical protein ACFOET_18315 [Parapedobacter deserti]|uniref:Uncharacterized protein n=1 Tax=Parapedobacter deserti TaxID=1912957 RepID=A0ABV7JQW9_9SPHI
MNKQIIFIHGAGDDGYEAGEVLVASLRAALGKDTNHRYSPKAYLCYGNKRIDAGTGIFLAFLVSVGFGNLLYFV